VSLVGRQAGDENTTIQPTPAFTGGLLPSRNDARSTKSYEFVKENQVTQKRNWVVKHKVFIAKTDGE